MINKTMIATVLASMVLWTGCVGVLTGHKYSFKDAVVVYKVTKEGVTTFMTEQEIKDKKLNKANDVAIKVYKIVQGNE